MPKRIKKANNIRVWPPKVQVPDFLRHAVNERGCSPYGEFSKLARDWNAKHRKYKDWMELTIPVYQFINENADHTLPFVLFEYSEIKEWVWVIELNSDGQLRQIIDAVGGRTPLLLHKFGLYRYGFECYMLGDDIWEMTYSEYLLGNEMKGLLILDEVDKERRKCERLQRKFSGTAGDSTGAKRKRIPEEVRIYVWRRDEGRCVQCGSQENLEYDHIIPWGKGGSSTERNVQLLCEKCNREKSDKI